MSSEPSTASPPLSVGKADTYWFWQSPSVASPDGKPTDSANAEPAVVGDGAAMAPDCAGVA
eukprot:CAMPEP_0117689484 /NCGR_PEP_ID=MMETSP0804-20121206/24524_1 /TAXON_ID=1074897 /ORGANISM="Tetraselmis astigmatica, Strain CCMP880" /LENGTH=60 /DNA_ID=CAMNT_0005502279 /DNA_START=636 /DNA_END=818 /DNA_ORIENTATION=-